jgi:hypothetical protein
MQSRLPLESDKTTAGFIKRIFHMLTQTLMEDTVRNAFTHLGFQ